MHAYAALDDALLVVRAERRDGGVAVEQVGTRLDGHRLQCVGVSGEVRDRVFVGTREQGLRRSVDGGETFERVDAFESAFVTAVAVSPHDPREVWAGTEPSAVYRSTDGGDSWERCGGLTDLSSAARWSFPPRPHTHHVRWLEPDPTERDRVYVAIEAGAFVRTTDGGDSWLDHPGGGRRDNHTLATHPDAPGRVYTAAGDGYAESADGGETWTYPQAGLDHRYVWGLAVDPGDPETVVVSAASGARTAHRAGRAEAYVYRRGGGTEGWERAMDGLPDAEGTVRAVLDAGEAGEFFALTNRGLFHSDDAARSWDRLDVSVGAVGRGLAVVA
jgi:photosystem II stability/assembly factor-like uncharacterized protein